MIRDFGLASKLVSLLKGNIMSNRNLVTIASYSFPYEAQIAKANLESEGMTAFIADEHTINMDWLYSNALGGVRLQVSEEDVVRARELLEQDFSELVDKEFGEEKPICQKCGSENIEAHTKGKKPAFLIFLLLGFPLFFYSHGTICKDCGDFRKT